MHCEFRDHEEYITELRSKTDEEMYEHVRHLGDHWILNYPIVLEPKQSAGIEVDMLIWTSLKNLSYTENLMRTNRQPHERTWLPFISTFRNFKAKGGFEYEITKQPDAAVHVAGIEADPLTAHYNKETKEDASGRYSLFVVFPEVVMPRMGLKLLFGID